jgi:DtxR family Mn-dependent transcriptional regulator
MNTNNKLSPNMEMYLKTILRLEQDNPSVRVKAIADSLGVTMPSVSEALRNLKAKGLVEHTSYGEVGLSEDGRRVAAGVNERFELLRKFLADMLRVDMETADREACEIEHVVGEATLTRLAAFVEWMTYHREDIKTCMLRFHEYLDLLVAGDLEKAKRLLCEGVMEGARENVDTG